VGRPEGRRQLGALRYRWWDDIKVDLQEVGWGALSRLIWLMTDRSEVHVNAVMKLWVTLSGRTLLYEVSNLVFYLCRKYYCGQCVSAVQELFVCQSVWIRHFFLCSIKF